MYRRFAIAVVASALLAASPSLPAAEKAFNCAIGLLRVNADRFFVRCEASRAGVDVPGYVREIPYYSAAYTQANARYLFDLLLAAEGRGKVVRLIFEDDPAENPVGCAPRNCRRIIAVSVGN